MDMFTFPRIGITAITSLSLSSGAVTLTFPFLGRGKVRFRLSTIGLLHLPSSRDGSIVMRQATSINASMRVFTVLLCLASSFLQTKATIYPRTVCASILKFRGDRRSLVNIYLVGARVHIAVTILSVSCLIASGVCTEPMTRRLFMNQFYVVLLHFGRLVIGIGVMFLGFLRLTYEGRDICGRYIRFIYDVRVVNLTLIKDVKSIFLYRFLSNSRSNVETTYAGNEVVQRVTRRL